MMKHCEWCEVEFEPKSKKGRFCGKSCSAKWRTRNFPHPSTRPEVRERVAAGVREWHKANPHIAQEASRRMAGRNPMRNAATREKVSASLRRMGHGPRVRGGNGTGPTRAEATLSEVFPEAVSQFVVRTKGAEGEKLPNHYKVDLAFPGKRLAVEVDGHSHNSLSRKAQDAKKARALESLGWAVLRFTNQQVADDLEGVSSTISACLATRVTS